MTLLIDAPAVRRRAAGFVLVGGPDRLTYLHTLFSQHFEDAVAGTAADFLYLDAKGNVIAAGRALVRDDDVVLVTAAGVAGTLAEALGRFRFLLDVSVEDVSRDWALASVRGPGEVAVADAPPASMTAEHVGPVGDGGDGAAGLVVRDRSGGVDLVGPRDWVERRVEAVGLPEALEQDWEAWRILAGEPAWEREVVAGRRPQELGLLPTHVHLRKGCYPGQESIAKTYNLGRPRRALSVVAFDSPVEAGVDIDAGGKSGTVTSAATTVGGAIALALLPLGRDGEIPGDGTVTADGATGRVLRRVGQGLPQPGA